MKHADIVMTTAQDSELETEMYRRLPRESSAFLLAGINDLGERLVLTVHECVPLPEDAYEDPCAFNVELKSQALIKMVNRAVETGCILIEAHSHPGSAIARFSGIDERGLRQVVPYMLRSLPHGVYGALVWGRAGVEARVWCGEMSETPMSVPVVAVRVVGGHMRSVPTATRDANLAHGAGSGRRYDRLERVIGVRGREAISSVRVAIVGLGGLGSNLVEALLAIGVREFVLVDRDVVKEENLDRIPYATPHDAEIGMHKVAIAERHILSRLPSASVCAIPSNLNDSEAMRAVKSAHAIFGGVDTYYARLILTNLAGAYLIPYFDCGTGVRVEEDQIVDMGGRVSVLWPGEHCLICAGHINDRELNYELASPDEKQAARLRGYVTGADLPQPMVGNLNGITAHLAAVEFMASMTGLRSPVERVYYNALKKTLDEVSLTGRGACRICQGQVGLADQSGVLERFSPDPRSAFVRV